jgi:hypothetical protein
MPSIREERTSAGSVTPLDAYSDFSLVAGGPLYRLWRRTRLSGDEMRLLRRRMVFLVLLTWVPLLLLAMIDGHAWGGGVALPFLHDLETHAKLLIATPLLIAAEVTVHRQLPRIVHQFLEHGLVPDRERPRFDAAIASAMRLRDSVVAELLLVVFVYLVGILFVWRTQSTLEISSWYATADVGGGLQLSRAGWWAAAVSLPVAQFLLVRWYFRLFIWGRFLWQVSRLRLNLVPMHPDGVAGLHFLSMSRRAYTQVLLAQGAVLSGMIANRIFFAGANLMSFKVELIGTVAVMVLAILGPLLAFSPQLRTVRREGLERFGRLGQQYAVDFDDKWLRDGMPAGEQLLGTADIQSLADLRNSFLVVRDVESVPFTTKNVLSMAVTTLLPVAPLLLTMFSVEQLLERMLKALL